MICKRTLLPGNGSNATRDKLERFDVADRVQRKGYRDHWQFDADGVRNDEML